MEDGENGGHKFLLLTESALIEGVILSGSSLGSLNYVGDFMFNVLVMGSCFSPTLMCTPYPIEAELLTLITHTRLGGTQNEQAP